MDASTRQAEELQLSQDVNKINTALSLCLPRYPYLMFKPISSLIGECYRSDCQVCTSAGHQVHHSLVFDTIVTFHGRPSTQLNSQRPWIGEECAVIARWSSKDPARTDGHFVSAIFQLLRSKHHDQWILWRTNFDYYPDETGRPRRQAASSVIGVLPDRSGSEESLEDFLLAWPDLANRIVRGLVRLLSASIAERERWITGFKRTRTDLAALLEQ